MKNTECHVVTIKLVRENEIKYEGYISNPEDAANFVRPFLADLDREAFYVISLNNSKKPVGINLVSIGTVNATIAEPREVFKSAILQNASSIIVAHNHPSGSSQPSGADIKLTTKIKECGKLLGIPLNDHIIIYGEDEKDFFSFANEGMLYDA